MCEEAYLPEQVCLSINCFVWSAQLVVTQHMDTATGGDICNI